MSDFEKLDKEFDIPPLPIAVDEFQQQKNELIQKSNNIRTLEDKEYLQQEIKFLVDNSKKVLDVIQKDIKIGSPPRMVEVYAKLLSSILEGIKELRELNVAVSEAEVRTRLNRDGGLGNNSNTNINVRMTAKELMFMMKEASSMSQMKAINTEFDVEERTHDGK
jgi:hypothetical protein